MTTEAITPLRQRMIERHERAQARCTQPAQSHLQLQTICRISEAVS